MRGGMQRLNIRDRAVLSTEDLISLGIGCRTKIYFMVKAGEFPQPIKYGNRNKWLTTEVTEWLAQQGKKRTQAKN